MVGCVRWSVGKIREAAADLRWHLHDVQHADDGWVLYPAAWRFFGVKNTLTGSAKRV